MPLKFYSFLLSSAQCFPYAHCVICPKVYHTCSGPHLTPSSLLKPVFCLFPGPLFSNWLKKLTSTPKKEVGIIGNYGNFGQYNMVNWKNTLVSNRIRDSITFLKAHQACLSGHTSGFEINEQLFAKSMYLYIIITNKNNSLSSAQKWFVEKIHFLWAGS